MNDEMKKIIFPLLCVFLLIGCSTGFNSPDRSNEAIQIVKNWPEGHSITLSNIFDQMNSSINALLGTSWSFPRVDHWEAKRIGEITYEVKMVVHDSEGEKWAIWEVDVETKSMSGKNQNANMLTDIISNTIIPSKLSDEDLESINAEVVIEINTSHPVMPLANFRYEITPTGSMQIYAEMINNNQKAVENSYMYVSLYDKNGEIMSPDYGSLHRFGDDYIGDVPPIIYPGQRASAEFSFDNIKDRGISKFAIKISMYYGKVVDAQPLDVTVENISVYYDEYNFTFISGNVVNNENKDVEVQVCGTLYNSKGKVFVTMDDYSMCEELTIPEGEAATFTFDPVVYNEEWDCEDYYISVFPRTSP